jgi:acyl-ACP thioesterase
MCCGAYLPGNCAADHSGTSREAAISGIRENAEVEMFRTEPDPGRVYATRRIVRSTDVTPSGRLRLDALARYLQIAAEDDLADSGLAEPVAWLVRRCELAIRALPVMGTRLTVRTFCSGTGPRWAERTTTLAGPDGPLAQATAVWAAVSRADGRPVALSPEFMEVYGPSAAGRTVSARLSHPRPDRLAVVAARAPGEGAAGESGGHAWPLRAADFDIAGHVNNAIHWAVVEDVLADIGCVPSVAEVEYHRAILPGCAPWLVTERREGEVAVWLLDSPASAPASRLLASARLAC